MSDSDGTASESTASIPRYPATVRGFRVLVDFFLLAGLAYWGVHLGGGIGLILAVVIPVVCGFAWFVLGVPNDPIADSRSIVRIPGSVRILLEGIILVAAAVGIWTAGSRAAAETLLTAAGLCYGVTWERLVWLARD